jgi:hypothetical protein
VATNRTACNRGALHDGQHATFLSLPILHGAMIWLPLLVIVVCSSLQAAVMERSVAALQGSCTRLVQHRKAVVQERQLCCKTAGLQQT